MEDADLKEIFSPFGEIINLHLARDEISKCNKVLNRKFRCCMICRNVSNVRNFSFIISKCFNYLTTSSEISTTWYRLLKKSSIYIFKGFAFIEYKLTKQAQDAQTSMNLFELCGKQLRIGRAIAPPFEVGGKKPDIGEIGFVIPKLSRPIKT